jgi:hypothetical protein
MPRDEIVAPTTTVPIIVAIAGCDAIKRCVSGARARDLVDPGTSETIGSSPNASSPG